MSTTPEAYYREVIKPGLERLGPKYDSAEAALLLVAIAGQESAYKHRRQIRGPARSYWQIEPPTARAVLRKWKPAAEYLDSPRVLSNADPDDLDAWLTYDDKFALTIARGILWLEPSPLPHVDDAEAAWDYYLNKTWRPGKPHPGTWEKWHELARSIVL